ncbi:peptidoglycan-binding protein [Enterococcus sp. LJL120]
MKKVLLTSITLFSVLTLAACQADEDTLEYSTSASSTVESTTASSKEATEASSDATSGASESEAGTIWISDGSEIGETQEIPAAGTIYMRQLYTAPHGDRAFAITNVTMDGDTIISARMDEFQYIEDDGSGTWTGVPNSDATFGESYPEGTILAGKEENNEAYSEMMAESGATLTWKDNMEAITDFVAGKTAAEIQTSIDELTGGSEVADVVTGATFADTAGYLQAIVDTATKGMVSTGIETSNTDLSEAMVLAAPHGDRSFAVVTVAMDGDVVANTFVDEFQYSDPASYGGVPNSDATFGEGVADGQVLASKFANNEAYSEMMASSGGATQTWMENVEAIDEFAKGKTIDELKAAVTELEGLSEDDSPADVVTGATFSDSAGYLSAIIEAAEAAMNN